MATQIWDEETGREAALNVLETRRFNCSLSVRWELMRRSVGYIRGGIVGPRKRHVVKVPRNQNIVLGQFG